MEIQNPGQCETKVWQCFQTMKLSDTTDDLAAGRTWLQKQVKIKGDNESSNVLTNLNGDILLKVPVLKESEVSQLFHTAKEAIESWKNYSTSMQCRVYQRLMLGIKQKLPLLAQLECLEGGRPLNEVMNFDVASAEKSLSFSLGLSSPHLDGSVVVGLLPSNLSFLSAVWIVTSALTMGSCVILKPSLKSTLSCLCLQEICNSTDGLPDGMVQTVTGGDEVGLWLAANPNPHKVVFEGRSSSSAISDAIVSSPYSELSVALSGKSSALVFQSADLDSAVEGVIEAAKFCKGQAPWSCHKVLVDQSAYDAFASRLKERIPNDETADKPEMLKNAMAQQHSVVHGNGQIWVVENVAPCSSLVMQPPNLPMLALIPFRTAKEAIAIAANAVATHFASVWSQDIAQALDVARGMKASSVWVNCHGVTDKSGRCTDACEISNFKSTGKDTLDAAVLQTFKRDANASMLYIDGSLKASTSNSCYNSPDTSTFISECNKKDILAAIGAATNALPSWKSTTPHRRAQVLCEIAEAGFHYSENTEAKKALLDYEELYECGNLSVRGREFEEQVEVMKYSSSRGVVGVVGADSGCILSLIGTALANGNTVVVAPNESNAAIGLEMMEVLFKTCIPPGIINVLTGSNSVIAEELVAHPGMSTVCCVNTPKSTAAVLRKKAGAKCWITPSSMNLQKCRQELSRRTSVNKTIWLPAKYSFAN